MRALVIDRPGAEPRLRDVPAPAPREGECLVRLEFAQVNHLDGELARGSFGMPAEYPLIPGMEGAGTIVAAPGAAELLGARAAVPYTVPCGDCAECRAGRDELCRRRLLPGVNRQGTYAEYIALSREQLVRLPDAVSLSDAAGFQGGLVVAWHAVRTQADLQPGDSVLITGATGSLGAALAEVARSRGAQAIGLARDAARAQSVSGWFAGGMVLSHPGWPDAVRERAGSGGLAAVIDLVGGDLLGACLPLLRPGGTLVALGSAGADASQIDARLFYQRQIAVRGSRRFRTAERDEVLELLARGELRLPPAQLFRLADARAALSAITSRTFGGRILIDLRGD